MLLACAWIAPDSGPSVAAAIAGVMALLRFKLALPVTIGKSDGEGASRIDSAGSEEAAKAASAAFCPARDSSSPRVDEMGGSNGAPAVLRSKISLQYKIRSSIVLSSSMAAATLVVS